MSSIERIESPIGKISICQRHDGGLFAGIRFKGKWLRAGLKTSDINVARDRAFEWLQRKIQPAFLSWAKPDEQASEKLLRKAFLRARKRAVQNGFLFSIDYQWLLNRARSYGMRCELSGAAYSGLKQNSFRAPFCPTIDRIDSCHGYTEENSRIVCAAVNWALSDWGDDVFYFVCDGVAMNGRWRQKRVEYAQSGSNDD